MLVLILPSGFTAITWSVVALIAKDTDMAIMNIPESAHQAGNATAVTSALAAYMGLITPILSGILLIAGLIWYGVLFYDRFIIKKKAGD